MSYWEFLVQPYNLPFLALGVVGVAVLLANRRSARDLFRLSAGLVAAGVLGLTLNGAVHDLALGDIGSRFPLVLVLALVLSVPVAWACGRLRDRFFRSPERVLWNAPGLEGREAKVVSRRVQSTPGSGRAQRHDPDGTMHLVRCHTSEASLGFGHQIRLMEYDDDEKSYLVEPL